MSHQNPIADRLPFVGILLVYFAGAFIDVMEVDAAQYASISREMMETGNYLEVFNRGEDYLDKPPFLFWVSALSMKLFGVSNWSYKLPSILFSLLGIFSTYKLGSLLYAKKVGRMAALILSTSLAMIIINNDIKTDTILTAAIIFSIWMLAAFLKSSEWKYLIGGAFGVGIAMLTKGPIGIVMPGLAIGGHLFLQKQWKKLFDWRWLVFLFVVGLLLIPMCMGLYRQYGSEGLKFYFWTQSFGRITGENKWQNNTTVLFFTHVFLWALLPWTFLAIAALFKRFKNLLSDLKKPSSEFITLCGIVLVWIALSLSRFKLPHYIFIVFPLMAIVTANHIFQLKKYVRWGWFQLILSSLALFLTGIILVYSFPKGGFMVPIVLIMGMMGTGVAFFSLYRQEQTIIPSVIAFIAIGLGLNLHFYPQLLNYQANTKTGQWVIGNIPKGKPFIGFATGGHGMDFYAQRTVPWMNDVASTINVIEEGTIIYARQECYDELLDRNVVPKDSLVFKNFEVQRLSIRFLNPNTREETLNNHYVLFY